MPFADVGPMKIPDDMHEEDVLLEDNPRTAWRPRTPVFSNALPPRR